MFVFVDAFIFYSVRRQYWPEDWHILLELHWIDKQIRKNDIRWRKKYQLTEMKEIETSNKNENFPQNENLSDGVQLQTIPTYEKTNNSIKRNLESPSTSSSSSSTTSIGMSQNTIQTESLTKETKKTKDDNETEKQLKDNTNDAMD